MRWLLLLALTGCFRTHDVEIPRSVHVMPTFVGPVTGIALNVTASYRTLHVDATRVRSCYREVRQFVEHREEADAGGGWILGGGLVGAIASATVDSLGAAIASSGEDSDVEDRSLSVTKTDCSIPASGARIAVVLPSGAIVRARADSRGLVHIQIPADEPASGTAIVRAQDAAVRVPYSPAN